MKHSKQSLIDFRAKLVAMQDYVRIPTYLHGIMRHCGFSFHEASCYCGTKFKKTTIGDWYFNAWPGDRALMLERSIAHVDKLIAGDKP